jgi:hypothetical protein
MDSKSCKKAMKVFVKNFSDLDKARGFHYNTRANGYHSVVIITMGYSDTHYVVYGEDPYEVRKEARKINDRISNEIIKKNFEN